MTNAGEKGSFLDLLGGVEESGNKFAFIFLF